MILKELRKFDRQGRHTGHGGETSRSVAVSLWVVQAACTRGKVIKRAYVYGMRKHQHTPSAVCSVWGSWQLKDIYLELASFDALSCCHVKLSKSRSTLEVAKRHR